MELSTALEADSYTKEEIALYLELVYDFIEQFQGKCPSVHDHLCIKAINSGNTALTDASNAFANAIDILKVAPTPRSTYNLDLPSNQKTVKIPGNWNAPKYCFGQVTKQGQIMTLEYYPPDTELSREFGEGWYYWTLPYSDKIDMEKYSESEIETLSLTEIQALIYNHESEIVTLREQLRGVS